MNTSRVLKWSVIFGIIIVLNLFFNYAISLAYKRPTFDCNYPVMPTPAKANYQGPTAEEEAKYMQCQKNFQTVNDTYNKNVFIVLVILGALSVLLGNFLGNAVIAQGLALGGVLSFIIASMRYWGSANDVIRLIILAIALGILFWIAYKKFNERVRP